MLETATRARAPSAPARDPRAARARRATARTTPRQQRCAVTPARARVVRAALADEKTHANAPATSVIVGGGPTGLACAIALARRGWGNIEVWERLAKPPSSDSSVWGDASRSYNVGLSGRGQAVLKDLGVLRCGDR